MLWVSLYLYLTGLGINQSESGIYTFLLEIANVNVCAVDFLKNVCARWWMMVNLNH
jgi:hypothetical protein